MDIYPRLAISLFVSTLFSITDARHIPLRQFAISCTFHTGNPNFRIIRYLVLIFFHCFQYTALILRRNHSSVRLSKSFMSASEKYFTHPLMNWVTFRVLYSLPHSLLLDVSAFNFSFIFATDFW